MGCCKYAKTLFHKFLEGKVVDILNELGIQIVDLADKGQKLPDIITDKFNIEVETGLKHDIKDLKKRAYISSKPTIIVIPNNMLYNKYKGVKNSSIVELKNLQSFIQSNFK